MMYAEQKQLIKLKQKGQEKKGGSHAIIHIIDT